MKRIWRCVCYSKTNKQERHSNVQNANLCCVLAHVSRYITPNCIPEDQLTLNLKSWTIWHVNTVITALIFLIHVLLINKWRRKGCGFYKWLHERTESCLKALYVCICLVLPPWDKTKYEQLLGDITNSYRNNMGVSKKNYSIQAHIWRRISFQTNLYTSLSENCCETGTCIYKCRTFLKCHGAAAQFSCSSEEHI